MRSRVTGVVALLATGAVLAGCGDSGGQATPATVAPTAAATTVAPQPAVSDTDAQTLCDTLFAAWQAGDDQRLAAVAAPAAVAALAGHPVAGAGLRASGQDCLLIEIDPKTDGGVAAVGDVRIGLAEGSPQAAGITWSDAKALAADDALAARVEAVPLAVTPGAGSGTATGQASLTDAPTDRLAAACVARSAKDACAELGTRISAGLTERARKRLLCAFSAPVAALRGTPTDFALLQRVLGSDAPPAVLDAVAQLRDGAGEPTAAAATLSGYVAPLCAG